MADSPVESIVDDIFDAPITRKKDHKKNISANKVSTYAECSLKAYFRYVVGLQPETVPAPVVFGGDMHDIAETCNLRQHKTGELPPVEELVEKFDSLWAKEGKRTDIDYGPKGGHDVLGELGKKMTRRFWAYRKQRVSCFDKIIFS